MIKAGSNPEQLPITYFYDYVSKIEDFYEKNNDMKLSISNSDIVQQVIGDSSKLDMNNFMKTILESAKQNSKRNPQGKRYEYELKLFCAHLYVISGLMAYEILFKNIGNLPSPSTLNRLIAQETIVQEGELNINGLLKYFKEKRLPKVLWISEDQTKIVERVRYNETHNTLQGLVSPLNDNGMPVVGFNVAETASDIKNLLSKNSVSSLINLVMVQPLLDRSAAFCLLAYGTENRFTARDVFRRWKYIESILIKHGFKVCGGSGDGDSKILKNMKAKSGLSSKSHIYDWFHVRLKNIYS